MKKLALAALALVLAPPAWAQHAHGTSAPAATAPAAALADGEIRRVNKEAKQVTIKHGPIENVQMPAMTMTFDVKDARLLDNVKPGDKVRFRVEKEGTGYVVTRLDSMK